jgi:hypothetical protein
VDEAGLASLFDSTLGTPRKLVMASRPRRFGKSFAAQSPAAFYSVGTDSRALFEGLKVSRRNGWDRDLNVYNVLQLDKAEAMHAYNDLAFAGLGVGRLLVDAANGSDDLDVDVKEALLLLGARLLEVAERVVTLDGSLYPRRAAAAF